MKPLAITACTLTTALGTGRAATHEALVAQRSGLAPAAFLDVELKGRHDRPVVEPPRQPPEVPAMGVTERPDEVVELQRGEVGDGLDAEAVEHLLGLGPDAPDGPHRQRVETAVLQQSPQPVEEHLNPGPGLDRVGGGSVHSGRTRPLVAPNPIPRDQQERGITDEVVQIIEPAMRIIIGPAV